MIYHSKFGNIYYQLSGPRGKTLVILCHGLGMDHRTFDKQVAALKEHYQVMVWDMPGHGRSSMLDNNIGYSLMAAHCLVELLEKTGNTDAVMVGLSLGSYVIQQFLKKYPEKVSATVHIGGASLYPGYSNLLKPAVSLLVALAGLIPEKIFYRFIATHRGATLEIKKYLEETISSTGKKLFLKITRDLVDDFTEGMDKPPEKPILITWGEGDIFTRGLSTKWHQRTPGSQFGIIKGANHIANQDNPEDFNRVLMSFLQTACGQG